MCCARTWKLTDKIEKNLRDKRHSLCWYGDQPFMINERLVSLGTAPLLLGRQRLCVLTGVTFLSYTCLVPSPTLNVSLRLRHLEPVFAKVNGFIRDQETNENKSIRPETCSIRRLIVKIKNKKIWLTVKNSKTAEIVGNRR